VATSCLQAGRLYRRMGREDLARKRFERACDAGIKESCYLAK